MPTPGDRAKAATIGEMATRANYEVLRAGRETVQRSARRWRRVTDGNPCGFCAMVASRGPVYHSQESAEGYHSRCGCTAEPFDGDPSEWEPTPDEQRFIDAYRESYRTGIKSGDLADRIEALLDGGTSAKFSRWRAGRDVRVAAGRDLPDFNSDNPLEFYGDRLSIADESETAATHLADLEQFSEGAHTQLRNHFAGQDDAGFYVGDSSVPGLDDLGHLSGVRPRGWDAGDSWDTVPGAYNPATRVCACGGGGHGHGATSLALHEGSHALDDALGMVSASDEFRDAYFDVHSKLSMNPYFTYEGNASGYLSEGFAESYAAWTKSRTLDRDGQIDALSTALGGYSSGGTQTRESLGRLVDYLSGLDSRLLSR